MNPELKVSLDIAQLVMLGGLVWSLAKMSKAVDMLGKVTDDLTKGLREIGEELTNLVGRVSFLEGVGVGGRRQGDRPR